MVNLQYRHTAFFRFAVHEKEHVGIKPGQHADAPVVARFRTWAQEQNLTLSDKDWEANLPAIQEQLSIEMQNVAYGIEAGFKMRCEKDPVVLKALEVLPQAETLLQKKLLLPGAKPTSVAAR
jgi:carboxyl-terminal processing protease